MKNVGQSSDDCVQKDELNVWNITYIFLLVLIFAYTVYVTFKAFKTQNSSLKRILSIFLLMEFAYLFNSVIRTVQ